VSNVSVGSPCRVPADRGLQGATSNGASTPDIDQPFGANAVGQIFSWRRRLSREVSAYSTVFPEFAQGNGRNCFPG
jgi:hypothetical protein